MVTATVERYVPPPDFEEEIKEPLLDLNLTDSTELWLIQWPANQKLDKNRPSTSLEFDGQELTLNLHKDGQLGSVEDSSGKVYDVVSFASQEPNVMVFQSSASESKVVGKISRRVSLVHYPDPNEIEEQNAIKAMEKYQRSSGTSVTSSHPYSTPTQSSKRTKSSMSGSRWKGSLSRAGESSKPSKKRRDHEPIGSMGHSAQDSGRGHSGVTSTGSMQHSLGNSTRTSSQSSDHSHRGKSKKRMKVEE